MSRCWTPEDQRRLAQARSDYERLLVESPGGISLVDPFYFEQTPIIEFCSSVSRNQHAESAEALVRRFARQHGIWLEDAGDHYNSQNGYCYPSASFRRLVDIGRSMAILFYLNDTIGRERMGLMSPAQAALGDCVRERLIRVCESFELRSDASGLERATLQVLLTLRRSAPAHWFQRFMLLWGAHLERTFHDHNAAAQGLVLSVDEYTEARQSFSAMPYTVALMEFAEDCYLDWAALREAGFADGVERLSWLCGAIGALTNDLFSLEKEFIDYSSDSNLVTVILLNHPQLSLYAAIDDAIGMIQGYLRDYSELDRWFEHRHFELLDADVELAECVRTLRQSIRWFVQAVWRWELHTERYKRRTSIFRENLAEPRALRSAPCGADQM